MWKFYKLCEPLFKLLLPIVMILGIFPGCSPNDNTLGNASTSTVVPSPTSNNTNEIVKAVIAYAGGTCEAPVYVACLMGF